MVRERERERQDGRKLNKKILKFSNKGVWWMSSQKAKNIITREKIRQITLWR